jgi:hypothetical protein
MNHAMSFISLAAATNSKPHATNANSKGRATNVAQATSLLTGRQVSVAFALPSA